MPLFDYPRLLVDLVLETLVRDDIHAASNARGTCRYFKEKIENELITNVSISDMYWTCNRHWMTKIDNAEAAFTYRLKFRPGRPDNNGGFPQLFERMIQELLHFRKPNDDEHAAAIRADYTTKMVHLLAFSWVGHPSCYLFNNDYLRVRSVLNNENLKALDMLAPAVAVRDQKAIEHYLQDPHWWDEYGIFGDVWEATISTGQTEIRFLLGKLQPQAILDRGEPIPATIISAYQRSIESHQVENAKLFIEFINQSGYLDQYAGKDTIEIIMGSGSIELFEYLHDRFPDIKDWLKDYDSWVDIGFVSACKNNHSDFVRFFLKYKDKTYLRTIQDHYIMWDAWNSTINYWVEDPVLVVAAKSDLSTLDALLEHNPSILNYENLLEISVLGFHHKEYLDSRDEGYEKYWFQRCSKDRSSHTIAQWLIDQGIPITRKTVNFINFLGRVIMSRPFLVDDFVMTLTMLLVNVKAHLNPRKLRKQIHVPVRKVLRRTIEEKPEMRMIGTQRYDFLASARELNAWLTGRR